jgi:ABC-type multidrug transport system fused ATPase/permease subunit
MLHHLVPTLPSLQEPFLFSGTVRSNLDPFQSYTEPDLWRAVESVGLKEAIVALQDGIDAHVVDGGNNFSQVGVTVGTMVAGWGMLT